MRETRINIVRERITNSREQFAGRHGESVHVCSWRKENISACSQLGNRSFGTWVRRRPRISNREPQESRESVDAHGPCG